MFRTRSIFSLPDELLSEILARVGACSLDDLLNAGLSCKLFNEITFDKYVLRQASIEKIPAMPWHKNYSFLEKCRDSGNPEALYKQGVVEFFSYSNLEAGVAYLDIATKSGHLGASYILGVIFLCKDDEDDDNESNQKGMQHLDKVYRAKRLSQCRNKLQSITQTLWKNYYLKPKLNKCPSRKNHGLKVGWPCEVDDIELVCETCRCHREVTFVCNILRGHHVYF
ncbi:putative F-box protein At1g67623 [Citrus sinensis]|uniref:putative F-box protein At1g67623 n=1 Tax=Citrus sinensis TaxID=2711 RepID=UPI0022789100|nr:putative F-box protein At1g67623 [Citrus sinensis]